ncbi:MAG: hypothetical protein E7478_06190 [Ruminococcaceae bacterium]|nr:hypothetical protein [Oscillospiraceae bacterium]MBE6902046.1 hypothetical protein [Oscillospiraceae bacterium]
MKHALRKYLSRRGSALFMVLSLMTALMILVMAMYFSVVGSRDVQYKVFYQEQAYRSSISLSDAVVSGLEKDGWIASEGGTEFITLLTSMENVGDVVTTNGNGFAAFSTTGAGKEEEDQLGAYTITITRLNDEKKNKTTVRTFDIAITTSTGGVIETTHSYISIPEQEPQELPQEGFNPFTSTGYVPNDSFLEGGTFRFDVVIDNENAALGAARSVTGQLDLKIYGNLSAGGSLYNEYLTAPCNNSDLEEPVVWAIRNKYTQSSDQTLCLGPSNTNLGLMMVGGDFIHRKGSMPKNCDIYVLGDLYLGTNQVSVPDNAHIYVYGNIYFDGGAKDCMASYKKGTVFCKGMYQNGVAVENPCDAWTNDATLPKGAMTPKEMAAELDRRTTSVSYSNWEINDRIKTENGKERADYIPELDPNNKGSYNEVDIYYNVSDKDIHYTNYKNEVVTVPAFTATKYLEWEKGNVLEDYFGPGQDLPYTACKIDDIFDVSDGNQFNNCALVIDTGNDPKNQYIIQLSNNRDFNRDGTREAFSWYPRDYYSSALQMSVIVKGKGSVVIDIPDDVVYQDISNNLVIHETLFFLLGGSIDTGKGTSSEQLIFKPGKVIDGTAAANMYDFIHTDCEADCSQCTYTKTDDNTTPECTICAQNGETNHVVEVRCKKHEYTYSFCPHCSPEKEPEKDNSGDYYGLCVNRIDRAKVDTALTKILSGSDEYRFLTNNGKNDIPYPTTNIFLVSCSESADIRISGDVAMSSGNKHTVSQNGFYGFIYAPYMTFKAYGDSSGGGYVRFCGGMIVSDYVFKDSMSTITCLPEYLPYSLMSSRSRSDTLSALSSKSWKVSLIGY